MLVSSEEAPEGWVIAAREAEPAVVGYVPHSYLREPEAEKQARRRAPPEPSLNEDDLLFEAERAFLDSDW